MFLPFPRSSCDQLKRVWFKTAPQITLTSLPLTSPHPSALFRCGKELGAPLWSKQTPLQIFTALDRGRESVNFKTGGLPHGQPRSHPLQEVCCSSALRSSSSACRVAPLQHLRWQPCLLSLQGSAARPLVRMAGGVGWLTNPPPAPRERDRARHFIPHERPAVKVQKGVCTEGVGVKFTQALGSGGGLALRS